MITKFKIYENRKVEWATDDFNKKLGEEFQFWEMEEYIITYHDPDDYDNDFYDRCKLYEKFVLEEIDISDLNLDEWEFNEVKFDDSNELYQKNKIYPPIVVGETSPDVILHEQYKYTILDGLHRANVLDKQGIKKIKAYVGKIDKSDNYFDDE